MLWKKFLTLIIIYENPLSEHIFGGALKTKIVEKLS